MRCHACGKSFSVAWAQPSPGGSSAPGVFLGGAVGLAAVAAWLFRIGAAYVPWVCIAIAGFIAIQVPVAWSDCRSRGGACPKCGADHTVRPWSL